MPRTARKAKLCGSLTTKALKKPYVSRWVGGVEIGSLGREDVVWHSEAVLMT